MINCHSCRRNYHYECVGISEKRRKVIIRFVCKKCVTITDKKLITILPINKKLEMNYAQCLKTKEIKHKFFNITKV